MCRPVTNPQIPRPGDGRGHRPHIPVGVVLGDLVWGTIRRSRGGGGAAWSWWCFFVFSDVAAPFFGREKAGEEGKNNKVGPKNVQCLCRPWVSDR